MTTRKRARVCGVLDQVSDASADCSRPEEGDQVIPEKRRRSIGKVVGGRDLTLHWIEGVSECPYSEEKKHMIRLREQYQIKGS